MLFAIDAKDEIHKGKDGIRTLIVDDFEGMSEADDRGWDASRDLIEAHCLDDLNDAYDLEEYEDPGEALEVAVNDDIDFKVYKIKDEYQKRLPKDLERLFSKDPDKFIEEYCEGENSTKAMRVFDKFS